MIVFSYPIIKRFIQKHTAAADAMNNWFKAMDTTDFADYHELKQVFSSVEGVGNDRYVFDIT